MCNITHVQLAVPHRLRPVPTSPVALALFETLSSELAVPSACLRFEDQQGHLRREDTKESEGVGAA